MKIGFFIVSGLLFLSLLLAGYLVLKMTHASCRVTFNPVEAMALDLGDALPPVMPEPPAPPKHKKK